jgi:hypothetical protein
VEKYDMEVKNALKNKDFYLVFTKRGSSNQR